EEMKILKEKYKIEEIQFTDDNMSINREFVKELCEKMKQLNFVWCTPTGIMMKTLDEEIIRLMAESGCYQLTFAIESANQRVLDRIIHKPLDLKIVKPLVDAAHKYGISIHTNNIISIPGEKKEEMLRTFEFNKEVGAESAAFFLPMPLPGSDLYKQCQERGWLDETEGKIDFKHVAVHIKETDPEYVMSGKELIDLVDKKTQEHNEWSRENNPEAWRKKFEHFLKKHPELTEKIMGRVT
ncbi:MAG TPA: radical SAM protein, partial [Candidatus Paceibacterota bacterium]|nr:radical SAM protein [Candidatus Paceibacterota bacterium]